MTTVEGQQVLFGDVFSIQTPQSATLLSIELVGASGVELVDSFVLPLVSEASLGVSLFPPTDLDTWSAREDAIGYVLEPGTDVNLAVVLERTGDAPGEVTSLRAGYSVDGKTYTSVGTTQYVLGDNCT
jgi:hypothetical protein